MDLGGWIGRASIKFTYSENSSISLPLKKTKSKDTKPSIDLLTVCKESTPPCHLNPLLFNGHMQTMYAAMKGRDVPIHYKRRIVESTDSSYPGSFAVDFVTHAGKSEDTTASESLGPPPQGEVKDKTLPPRTQYFSDDEWQQLPSNDTKPMLVALHGIAGGSNEIYIRSVIEPLVSPTDPNLERWEACVVNARGCARSNVTSPMLFNARASWDLRQMVKWLRENFPNRPLFAIGFSLGANILTDYLGEEGEKCAFKAAVLLSNPWNLEAGSLHLQRSWIGLNVYSKTLATNMKKLFERHVDTIRKDPKVNVERIRNTTYLHEFDRELQGPVWGYPTEGAYYRDASSTDMLAAVRVPVFALHADDDPVAPKEALPFEEIKQNPYAVLCTTSLGGHLGWFENGSDRWFVKPPVNFLRRIADEVDLEALGSTKLTSDDLEPWKSATKPQFDPVRRRLWVPT